MDSFEVGAIVMKGKERARMGDKRKTSLAS